MYTHLFARRRAIFMSAALALAASGAARAQEPAASPHQHDAVPQDPHAGHDMSMMQHEGMAMMPASREASGTSWLPDDTPMYGMHRSAGPWMLMGHANVFLQYLGDGSDRGAHQTGSINWAMGMASREIRGGRLTLTGMVSAEPWTIRGCGYPDLLASGERCDGEAIHDRQHPHDLFMELAASYDRPLAGSMRWQIYGAPVGEPALGPVAFPHRLSALANPLAPISHHWFDATHISFGVVTGGVYGPRWKAEASAFNGREPDEHRRDFDVAALDSLSGRFWFLPSRAWALQVSAGQLTDAEPSHDGSGRIDLTRVTASATYHRVFGPGSYSASTFGWGRNSEANEQGTVAFFAETTLARRDRHVWFGRIELSQKSGHDLALDSDEVSDVTKLLAGYTRLAAPRHGWQAGIGGAVTLGLVPAPLTSAYGGRTSPGAAVFLTLRPSRSE